VHFLEDVPAALGRGPAVQSTRPQAVENDPAIQSKPSVPTFADLLAGLVEDDAVDDPAAQAQLLRGLVAKGCRQGTDAEAGLAGQ
jgi:hypothetical protein